MTGVMAMMMTGRVLLVCALCVLWCGACCGEPSEKPPPALPDNASSKEKPQNQEEAVVVVGDVDPKSKTAAPQVPAPEASELQELPPESSRAQQSSGGASKAASTTMDKAKQQEEKKEEQKQEEEEQDEEEDGGEEVEEEEEEEEQKGRDSKSDGREGVTEEALEKDKMGQKAPTETPGVPTSNEEKQTATTQVNGESSPEALGDVKQSEEVQGEKVSNDNPQTKSVASIAVNRQNEPPADHGESGPPSPTANGDAASNGSDKSTEDGISNRDPAADGAGTAEGKQNENKDANPQETPVTAAAMKTTTATTGDSDGSTVVSHTTSPLLLLLVVACAAAAAVVAV
ncbi:mucin-associated surface protein (MASP), putative [Trypanosoma cruzi]|nr:mucin-associated surface protein (MASP), putative [Trypanosoma cruzi]